MLSRCLVWLVLSSLAKNNQPKHSLKEKTTRIKDGQDRQGSQDSKTGYNHLPSNLYYKSNFSFCKFTTCRCLAVLPVLPYSLLSQKKEKHSLKEKTTSTKASKTARQQDRLNYHFSNVLHKIYWSFCKCTVSRCLAALLSCSLFSRKRTNKRQLTPAIPSNEKKRYYYGRQALQSC